MTAPIQTNWAKGILQAPNPCGADDVCAVRYSVDLTTAQLVLNRIIELGPLPAGCVPVHMILDSDDLDTDGSPAVTLDVGLMSGDAGDPDSGGSRTCGAEFFSASTLGQAGGVAEPSLKGAYRITKSEVDRGIGLKISAAPDAAQAGTVGLTVLYRQGD
jgi:hypothetical protein